MRGRRIIQRAVLAALVLATAGILVFNGRSVWVYLKARRYDSRIRKGGDPGPQLAALGLLHHPIGARFLEAYAFDSKSPLQYRASAILQREYPDSYLGGGMREYQAIVSHPYLGCFGSWGWLETVPPKNLPLLLEWIDRYPLHPGVDDAYLQLGAALAGEDPLRSLELLHRGLHAPDGDKALLIGGWFQRVIERHASAEALEAWARSGSSDHLLDNVLYGAAVKRLRERQFREAADLFARAAGARRAGGPEMRPVFWPSGDPWPRVEEQAAGCRWLASKEEEARAAAGAEERSAVLHEMARRCFREPDLFRNRLYYPRLLADDAPRAGPLSMDHVHPGNGFRQAHDLFRRIASENPGYSRIDEVEYSIPLCAWRFRRSCPPTELPARLDLCIAAGFQDFADRHPRSTMADEALYLAGIHHWLASGRRDFSLLRANARKIREEHGDGNVIREHSRTLTWAETGGPPPEEPGGADGR